MAEKTVFFEKFLSFLFIFLAVAFFGLSFFSNDVFFGKVFLGLSAALFSDFASFLVSFAWVQLLLVPLTIRELGFFSGKKIPVTDLMIIPVIFLVGVFGVFFVINFFLPLIWSFIGSELSFLVLVVFLVTLFRQAVLLFRTGKNIESLESFSSKNNFPVLGTFFFVLNYGIILGIFFILFWFVGVLFDFTTALNAVFQVLPAIFFASIGSVYIIFHIPNAEEELFANNRVFLLNPWRNPLY